MKKDTLRLLGAEIRRQTDGAVKTRFFYMINSKFLLPGEIPLTRISRACLPGRGCQP
jgi:hypothetical protein